MDPAKWQRIKSLFEAALEKAPADRGEFLARASGGDASVLTEVESLLACREGARSFPGASAAAQLAAERFQTMTGRRIGKYEIVRELGRGGMAVVYLGARADDQYHMRVAIKLVLPGFDDQEVLRRFRNERQTLAALDHPNIVKLLDGGSIDEGRPYLVMEYVEGVPIDEYCDAHRLATTERLQLFRQVCSAVQYAHLNLVIHRDLKPNNILVTADGTPKLLDFGIAKLLNPEYARTLLVTATNLRLMTPQYASPEQVRGEPLTPLTDVYSLGVILYELLTGHRPYHFKRYTPLEIEQAICEREPEKPSTAVSRIEEIPDGEAPTATTITPEQVSRTRDGDTQKLRRRLRGDLDVIVLTALRKEPQRRYASVFDFSEDIRRHLEHLPVKARSGTIAYRAGKLIRRHKEAAIATLVFLSLLVGLTAWEVRQRRLETRPVGVAPRRSVAVLGFKNVSERPETAWLSTALSEMLTTELGADGKIRTIPGEDVAKMKVNLTLPDTDALAPATLVRVRNNLNTDLVILGSYVELSSGQMRIDLRLQDTKAGETVAETAETGTEGNLFDLVTRAGTDLRAKLGITALNPSQVLSVKASLPSNPEATRLYTEGLAKVRGSDAINAVALLEKAAGVEPEYPLVHRALAEAWELLGYDEKSRTEAKKAVDTSTSLGPDERRWVEAQYRNTAGQFDKAIEIYTTLFQSYPDNLDYGLQLAKTEIKAGKGKRAIEMLTTLRRLPAPVGTDPRIDQLEAGAADTLGDFNREFLSAQRAERKARDQGARFLAAEALNSQAIALWKLGRGNQALAAYQQAAEIYGEVHDQHGVAMTLNNRAILVARQGDFAQAEKMYQEAFHVFSDIGNQRHAGRSLSDIAVLRFNQGDLAVSRQDFERSLELARQSGDKGSEASVLVDMGELLFHEGNLEGARKRYREAHTIAKETSDDDAAAYAEQGLGDVFRALDELETAEKQYSEALEVGKRIGDDELVADTQLGLAQLFLDKGLLAQAERLARDSKVEFNKEQYAEGEIDASGVLASCLLAAGKATDALKEIDADGPLLSKSKRYRTKLQFAITTAQVRASTDALEAREKLEQVLAEAKGRGFVSYEFDALLALAQIEITSGKTAALARSRLEALEQTAKAKGFRLIARKAKVARKG